MNLIAVFCNTMIQKSDGSLNIYANKMCVVLIDAAWKNMKVWYEMFLIDCVNTDSLSLSLKNQGRN